jgi:hypothetical protein
MLSLPPKLRGLSCPSVALKVLASLRRHAMLHIFVSFVSKSPRRPAASGQGEAVVADESLPDHKGEPGVPQGIAGVVIDYCPTYDPMRKSIRRRDAFKAARSKPEAQLKGVKARLEGLSPAYCPVIEAELMLS